MLMPSSDTAVNATNNSTKHFNEAIDRITVSFRNLISDKFSTRKLTRQSEILIRSIFDNPLQCRTSRLIISFLRKIY
ncbi:unnamed protein product [Haemonchus placei]|uniref:Uncharacterized protein n=1 Tax=Haemonchus placei TaxID=6290 RepID=A0A3P7YCW1_HAEPC|nr:unnamed protein product [Haemonchus placei]